MRVRNEIEVYEVNGDEKQEAKPLIVENHWNIEFVVLKRGSLNITVDSGELKKALKNATHNEY